MKPLPSAAVEGEPPSVRVSVVPSPPGSPMSAKATIRLQRATTERDVAFAASLKVSEELMAAENKVMEEKRKAQALQQELDGLKALLEEQILTKKKSAELARAPSASSMLSPFSRTPSSKTPAGKTPKSGRKK